MITTGVIGAQWRATVTPWGGIEPNDGTPALQWHIAADDRWHSPEREPAVRQTRLEGTAVVETRVRIPDGDSLRWLMARAQSMWVNDSPWLLLPHRLLEAGELTAVFPEGYKGLGKPFKDRYKLQRFGRGGFVSAASSSGRASEPRLMAQMWSKRST